MPRTMLLRTAVIAALSAGVIVPTVFGGAAGAYAAASTDTATEAQRDRVRWLVQVDARGEVRKAAATALATKAVTKFLTSGLTNAMERAAAAEERNMAQIRNALATSPGAAVQRGCLRALKSTHDDKEAFVRTGLAEARRLDAAGAEQQANEVAEQAAEDRAYVAERARTDPGAQVRSAASLAANSGSNEAVAEFFAYYWAAGARVDDEAFRLRMTALDAQGHAAMERLRAAALDAQKAEAGASGEAAAKLHAETVAAWTALAAATEGTSVDWAAERDRAAAQAEAWGRVAEYATGATTEQDWAGVLARAGASRQAWAAAAADAAAQAAFWMAQADAARDSATGDDQ